METSALPGKREELNRAGITPRILGGTIDRNTSREDHKLKLARIRCVTAQYHQFHHVVLISGHEARNVPLDFRQAIALQQRVAIERGLEFPVPQCRGDLA